MPIHFDSAEMENFNTDAIKADAEKMSLYHLIL